MPSFADRADFELHFQPFQLYPHLPSGDSEGVDKRSFHKQIQDMNGGVHRTDAENQARREYLRDAWAQDGLQLSFDGDDVRPAGTMGNSVDAQRLIMLARRQGKEDGMIEAIYTANHVKNECLSDFKVLLRCAEEAGVTGAEEYLKTDQGKAEHAAKVRQYRNMGINSVPVIVINDKYPINGAPDKEYLADVFNQLIERGTVTLKK